MKFLFGKSREKEPCRENYDRENKIPIIRASICTGEQVEDKKVFLERYGIEPSELKKEW